MACLVVEELAGHPVELHGLVRADVFVGPRHAFEAHRERRPRSTVPVHLEAHAGTALDQVDGLRDHAFAVSHAWSSVTE